VKTTPFKLTPKDRVEVLLGDLSSGDLCDARIGERPLEPALFPLDLCEQTIEIAEFRHVARTAVTLLPISLEPPPLSSASTPPGDDTYAPSPTKPLRRRLRPIRYCHRSRVRPLPRASPCPHLLSLQTLADGHQFPRSRWSENLSGCAYICTGGGTSRTGGSMARMERHATGVTAGRGRGPLSPGVYSTLRMVSRAVTQLYDDVLRPSGLRVTQLSILATVALAARRTCEQLEAALAIDRRRLPGASTFWSVIVSSNVCPTTTGGFKAMRLTGKGKTSVGRCAAAVGTGAGPGSSASSGGRHGADAQRRLARLLDVAVVKRRLHRDRSRRLSGRRS